MFSPISPIRHAHLMCQQLADLLVNFAYAWMETHISWVMVKYPTLYYLYLVNCIRGGFHLVEVAREGTQRGRIRRLVVKDSHASKILDVPSPICRHKIFCSFQMSPCVHIQFHSPHMPLNRCSSSKALLHILGSKSNPSNDFTCFNKLQS